MLKLDLFQLTTLHAHVNVGRNKYIVRTGDVLAFEPGRSEHGERIRKYRLATMQGINHS